MDPHTTQEFTNEPNDTFTSYVPYCTTIPEIDPSLAYGFLTKNSEEFSDLLKTLESSKLISVFKEKPVFDFDWESSVI